MNRIDELTYKEIAERLEISVKAVEKRMHEALEELRKTIAHKF
jgi:RNA polymerase sigma-70 factor (ECF subfamily)